MCVEKDSGPVAESLWRSGSQVGRQEEDSLAFSLPKILEKACCPLEKSLDSLAQVENQHKVTSERSSPPPGSTSGILDHQRW